MRIIAGLYRGRTLKTLRGLELRPTSGRLRETLFDVLGGSVEGSAFIDGYAGSGAVGLEALSRGARRVFFIEESTAAVRIIQANMAALGVCECAEVVRTSFRKGLIFLEQRGVQADFCFLDPPYAARREYDQSLLALAGSSTRRLSHWTDLTARSVMSSKGLVIVQHSRKEPLEERVGPWRRVRLLFQGSSALSFYRIEKEGSNLQNSGGTIGHG